MPRQKALPFLLMLCALLLLCACGQSTPVVYTVTKGGEEFDVDAQNGTVTSRDQVYTYRIDQNRIEITYPGGATYWWQQQENGGYGGWSDDYDEMAYASGEVLRDVLSAETTPRGAPKNLFLSLLLAGFGVWNIASPYSSWYVSHGWQYKNVEPSESYLGFARLSGFVLIGVAILLLFVS